MISNLLGPRAAAREDTPQHSTRLRSPEVNGGSEPVHCATARWSAPPGRGSFPGPAPRGNFAVGSRSWVGRRADGAATQGRVVWTTTARDAGWLLAIPFYAVLYQELAYCRVRPAISCLNCSNSTLVMYSPSSGSRLAGMQLRYFCSTISQGYMTCERSSPSMLIRSRLANAFMQGSQESMFDRVLSSRSWVRGNCRQWPFLSKPTDLPRSGSTSPLSEPYRRCLALFLL